MLVIWGLIAFASAWLEDDDVVVLKTDMYDEFVNPERNFISMLEFYAPWCGHCKQFAPTYAEIAKELKARDPPIRIAKVDATEVNFLVTCLDGHVLGNFELINIPLLSTIINATKKK